MAAFRLMLAGMLLVLTVYTGAVTYQYGPDFLPVFFSGHRQPDMARAVQSRLHDDAGAVRCMDSLA